MADALSKSLHERESSPAVDGVTALVTFSIFAICLLVMCPLVWMVWILQVNRAAYYQSGAAGRPHLKVLPTCVEHAGHHRPAPSSRPSKIRMVAYKLCGVSAAACHMVALRSRGLFQMLQGYASGLVFQLRHRRRANGGVDATGQDLPIMQQPAWQKLAESHTEDKAVGGKGSGVELQDVKVPEAAAQGPAPPGTGGGESTGAFIETPKPALVAG